MPAETHSHRAPWSDDELRELVLDRLADAAELDPDAISPGMRLDADLGLADLARLDLAEAIEEDLGERTVGFAFDDDDLAECATVGDLVECVIAIVATHAPAES